MESDPECSCRNVGGLPVSLSWKAALVTSLFPSTIQAVGISSQPKRLDLGCLKDHPLRPLPTSSLLRPAGAALPKGSTAKSELLGRERGHLSGLLSSMGPSALGDQGVAIVF